MTATADATDRSTVKKLIATVKSLRDAVEQQADRIDDLEAELAQHKDHTGREFADVRGRITDVEETAATADTHPGDGSDAQDTASGSAREIETQTPLERICGLPEHVVDRELTANQERARFIARDIRDYAEKAPAGLVVDSRTIKRVITASEEKRPHTQTVARVMNFLDELGKDEVQLKKRRGKKFVVVDPEAATKFANASHHTRCDGESGPTHAEGVIPSG